MASVEILFSKEEGSFSYAGKLLKKINRSSSLASYCFFTTLLNVSLFTINSSVGSAAFTVVGWGTLCNKESSPKASPFGNSLTNF